LKDDTMDLAYVANPMNASSAVIFPFFLKKRYYSI